jgi:hypothetical protein
MCAQGGKTKGYTLPLSEACLSCIINFPSLFFITFGLFIGILKLEASPDMWASSLEPPVTVTREKRKATEAPEKKSLVFPKGEPGTWFSSLPKKMSLGPR